MEEYSEIYNFSFDVLLEIGQLVIPKLCNYKRLIRITNYVIKIFNQNYLGYFVINSHGNIHLFFYFIQVIVR